MCLTAGKDNYNDFEIIDNNSFTKSEKIHLHNDCENN